MLRLYDSRLSGNCWKVRILLRQLGLPFEQVTLDLAARDTQRPAFRALSRFARVPVLQLADGRTIVESGAILLHLAEGTSYLPADPFLRSEVVSWLFFEQADLQKSIAIPRVLHLRGAAEAASEDIRRYHQEGKAALQLLDDWLRDREWLVGSTYTIADISLFAYASMAHEGGYDMAPFGAIRRWAAQVTEQPGWVPLEEEAFLPTAVKAGQE